MCKHTLKLRCNTKFVTFPVEYTMMRIVDIQCLDAEFPKEAWIDVERVFFAARPSQRRLFNFTSVRKRTQLIAEHKYMDEEIFVLNIGVDTIIGAMV